MEWQPIETAPSGTRVLVYIVPRERRARDIFIGYYDETNQEWHIPATKNISGATHWMSLPEAPMKYRQTEGVPTFEEAIVKYKEKMPTRALLLVYHVNGPDPMRHITIDRVYYETLPYEWPWRTKYAVLKRLNQMLGYSYEVYESNTKRC